MKTAQIRGFTLIELLTVIAIMAILMGFVVVGLPRALEKAKIADVETDMNGIRTALTQYMADHGSYPPRYGYLKRGWESMAPTDRYYLLPYMARIGLFGAFDSYDRFNLDSHDTNSDDVLQPLEFCPSGIYNPATDRVEFLENMLPYDGPGSIPAEEAKQLEEQGPYVYLPVNLDQFKKLKKAIGRTGDLTSESIDWPTMWTTLGFRFPPPKYDAFVLISVGPLENTFGILSMNESGPDMYHKLALRAYYLATRDINNGGEGNDVLDFDFRARTKQDEAAVLDGENAGWGFLPDVQLQLGPGPLIGKFE